MIIPIGNNKEVFIRDHHVDLLGEFHTVSTLDMSSCLKFLNKEYGLSAVERKKTYKVLCKYWETGVMPGEEGEDVKI